MPPEIAVMANGIGVEAGTRFSLGKISDHADNRKIIFFQGNLHRRGVEEWCRRNSVDLKVLIPPSVIRLGNQARFIPTS